MSPSSSSLQYPFLQEEKKRKEKMLKKETKKDDKIVTHSIIICGISVLDQQIEPKDKLSRQETSLSLSSRKRF